MQQRGHRGGAPSDWRDIAWHVALVCPALLVPACSFELAEVQSAAGGGLAGTGGLAVGGATGAASPGDGGHAGGAGCPAPYANCHAGTGCETNLYEDIDHCGACGHACLGAACAFGTCAPELLVSLDESARPYRIAIDDSSVYFTTNPTSGEAAVMKAPKDGGLTSTLASGSSLWGLVLDDTSVFFGAGGTLQRVDKDGSGLTELASFPGGAWVEVTADASDLYVVAVEISSGSTVFRLAKSGGTPLELATDAGRALSSAVDTDSVYWSSPETGSLMKVAKSGGPAVALLTDLVNPMSVMVDASHVYVVLDSQGPAGSWIVRADKQGGGLAVLAESDDHPTEFPLAMDSERLGWALQGSLMRVDKGGVDVLVLANFNTGFQDFTSIAMADDEPFLYWADAWARQIVRVAK